MATQSPKADANTNHLLSFLSKSELSHVSKTITGKINKYINTKFEEFSTAHAVLDTTKCRIGK